MSDAVPALRRFRRFYTHRLGLLTQSRVLDELTRAAQSAVHADDARRSALTLRAQGRRLFDTLDAACDAQAALDPARERAWVAEHSEDGAQGLGAAFVVRMLYVEPAARCRCLGARLVDECIGFARATGYRALMLRTRDVLHAARRLYGSRGVVRVPQERHRSFGHALVGKTWTLAP
jgi:GNAT superfamily N-acetyltransferase